MSYKEELFSRLEVTGIETQKEIIDWLTKDGKITATSKLTNLSKDLAEPFEVERDIREARTLRELEEISTTVELSRQISRLNRLRDEREEDILVTRRSQVLRATSIEEIVDIIRQVPSEERKRLRKDGEFVVRGLKRKGIIAEDEELPARI